VYAHDDEDWAWVYMEAIEPAVGAFSGKYQEALLATFPKLVKYILQSNLRSRINPTNTDDIMLVIATAAARLARGDRRLPATDSLMFTIKNWTDDNEDQIIANADPAFLELSKAMVEYDIAPDEIREKNVGYGKDGKLIIIDSSIFSEG
jgi:hypothetical protein